MADNRANRIRLYAWGVAGIWTALIVCSLVWNHHLNDVQVRAVSRAKAITAFEWGRLYRIWVSRQGGVYVPVTPQTPSNPLLSLVPERDITTPSGKTLTLMNSAYMAHKVFDSVEQPEKMGKGRITSLNPLNPENKPDPWEEKALHAFERGINEVSEIQDINGHTFLRLMRVSITEKPCLQCHGNQGYKVGDIRGGIGVTVPISDILEASQSQMAGNYVAHGMIWLLGLGVLGIGSRKLSGSVQALQESEERYRAVVEDQTEVICRFTADGTIVFVNEVYCRFFGKAREDLLGQKWQPNVVSEDIPAIEDKLTLLSPRNPVVIIENRVYSATKSVHWMQFVNRGFYDGSGNLSEIQAVGRDVTDRKGAEDALRTSDERLNLALASSKMGVWEWNLQSNAVYWSPECHEVVGLKEFDGTFEAFAELLHPDDAAHVIDTVDRALAHRSTYADEFRIIRPDGEQRWLSNLGCATYDTNESPLLLTGTVCDITDRKQLEDELRQALDAANAANSTMSRLLRTVAHEFRTPLGLLTGSTDILDRYWDRLTPEKRLEQNEHIRSAASQMSNLVNSVLSFNPLGTLRSASHLVLLDIGDVCRTIASEVETVWSAGHECRVTVDATCGTALLDEFLFRRILENLLTNAFRYTPPGGAVSLNVHREKDRLSLEIRDTGIGIPEEDQERVFEAFYRSRNVAGRRGLGLGLTIVSESLSQLAGTMTVDSTIGVGTTMRVEIPVAEPA